MLFKAQPYFHLDLFGFDLNQILTEKSSSLRRNLPLYSVVPPERSLEPGEGQTAPR